MTIFWHSRFSKINVKMNEKNEFLLIDFFKNLSYLKFNANSNAKKRF